MAAGHASRCIRLVDEVEHGGEGVRPKRAHGNKPAHARKWDGGWGGWRRRSSLDTGRVVAHDVRGPRTPTHPHTLTPTNTQRYNPPTHPHPNTHPHKQTCIEPPRLAGHSRKVLQVQIVDELGDEVQEGEALKQEDGLDHAQVVEDGAREGNHQGPKPARREKIKRGGALACPPAKDYERHERVPYQLNKTRQGTAAIVHRVRSAYCGCSVMWVWV